MTGVQTCALPIYGADAVIPTEIGLTSYRVQSYTEDKNEEAMSLQLDLVDEVRAVAEQRLARYQNLMSKNYDLVLRKVMGAVPEPHVKELCAFS